MSIVVACESKSHSSSSVDTEGVILEVLSMF